MPEETSSEPAAHYDRVTEAWRYLLGDDLHYGVFATGAEDLPAATGALTDRMAVAAELSAGLRVLDVGCGTGAPACELAERFKVSVLGITTSLTGVGLARERARQRGLGTVTFEQRDATANGLPDASVDRVWVLESSHLMRAKDLLLDESARVLAPGGRLVLCDIVARRELPFLEVRRLLREFTLLRAVFGDAHMVPLSKYVDLAHAAGIEVTDASDLTELTLPTFARWRDNARRCRGEVAELVGEGYLHDFVEAADVLEGFWKDGTLGYGLLAGAKRTATT